MNKTTIISLLLLHLIIGCKNKSQRQSTPDRGNIIALYDNRIFDKSLELALEYSKTHTTDTLVTLIIASCYEETGEYQKSIQAYNNALHLGYLSRTDYFGYMGDISRSLKDYKSAFSFYDSVLAYSPTDYKILLSRGLTYENLGLFQNAINDYRTLIKFDSNYKAEALSNIGLIYMNSNNLDSAAPYLKEAYTLMPHSITCFNLAVYYRKHEMADSALLYYTNAIEYSPNNPFYSFERGNYLYTVKQEKKACEDWSKAANMKYEKAEQRIKEYCK